VSLGSTIFLAASLFAAGPVGTVDLTADVRSETRLRSIDEDDGELVRGRDRELVELGIQPRLMLRNDARLRLALTYAPSLRVPYESLREEPSPDDAAFADDRTTFQHNATLTAERAISHWTLRGGASATYGFYDPLDREQAQARGQPLLSSSRLPFQAYALTAGFTTLAWLRTTLSVDAIASTGGGDGPMARASLPTQDELRLTSALDHEANRRDRYGALLNLTRTQIEGGDNASTLDAGGRWSRTLTPTQELRLSGGVSVAMVETEADSHERAGPWAEGAWTYLPAPHLPSLRMAVGGAPSVDRLSGSLSYRAYAEGRAGWAPLRDWTFELAAGGALLEPWLGFEDQEVSSTWMGTAGARVGWELTPRLSVGGGLAALWQDSGRADLVSFREFVATVDLVATLLR